MFEPLESPPKSSQWKFSKIQSLTDLGRSPSMIYDETSGEQQRLHHHHQNWHESDMKKMQNENAQLNVELAECKLKLTQNYERMRWKQTALESQLAKCNAKIEFQTRQNHRLLQHIEEQKMNTNLLRSKLETSGKSQALLAEEIAALNLPAEERAHNLIEQSELLVSDLQSKLKETESKLKEAEKQIADTQSLCATQESSRIVLSKKCEELERTLAQQRQDFESEMNLINELNTSHLDEMLDELAEERINLNKLQLKLNSIYDKLFEANEKLSQFENENKAKSLHPPVEKAVQSRISIKPDTVKMIISTGRSASDLNLKKSSHAN